MPGGPSPCPAKPWKGAGSGGGWLRSAAAAAPATVPRPFKYASVRRLCACVLDTARQEVQAAVLCNKQQPAEMWSKCTSVCGPRGPGSNGAWQKQPW